MMETGSHACMQDIVFSDLQTKAQYMRNNIRAVRIGPTAR